MSDLSREDLEKTCRGYSEAFRDVIPPGVGFAVFLFDYGQGGNTAYFSSANRADMLNLLKEWIALQESPK